MATKKQLIVRKAFKNAIRCWINQPAEGGVTPPDIGPRSRQWWYANTDEPWYFNFFMKQSITQYLLDEDPDWGRSELIPIAQHYYVDENAPDTTYAQSPFLYSAAFKYGGNSTPYIRRSFLSLDLSGISKEDAAKSHSLKIIFTYKNTFHPLPQPREPEIGEGFYFIDESGELAVKSWNTQFNIGAAILKFSFETTENSTDILMTVKITDIYKQLIADNETHLNIGFKADLESGALYPVDPMTLYAHKVGVDGTDIIAYLSYA